MSEAFALGAAASVATLLLGLGRGKAAAIFLGPVGLGVVGDVNQAIQLMFVPITVLAGPALVSVIAKAHKEDNATAIAHAYRTVMTALPLAGVVGLLAAVSVGPYLVNLDVHVSLPLLGIAALAIATKGIYGVQRQVLIALGDIPRATVISLVNSVVVLVALTIGAALFGTYGYLGFPLIGTVLCVVLAVVLLRRSAPGVDWRMRPRWDRALLQDSAHIGVAVLVNNLTMQATLVAIRWQLAEQGGQSLNGLFQAAWSLGTVQVNTLLMALGQFVFPRYAAASSVAELTEEVRSASRFMLRVTPPIVFVALGLRDVALYLLFSSDFLASGPLLSCLLVGALCKVVHWNQNGPLLYRGQVMAAIFNRLLSTATVLLLCWFLIPRFGLLGVGLAFLFNQIQSMLVSALVLRASESVPVGGRELVTSLGWAALAATMAYLSESNLTAKVATVGVGVFLAWRSELHLWAWQKVRRRLPGSR